MIKNIVIENLNNKVDFETFDTNVRPELVSLEVYDTDDISYIIGIMWQLQGTEYLDDFIDKVINKAPINEIIMLGDTYFDMISDNLDIPFIYDEEFNDQLNEDWDGEYSDYIDEYSPGDDFETDWINSLE